MISTPSPPPIPTPPAPPNVPIATITPPNARQPGSLVNPLVGFDATVQGNERASNTGKTFLGQ